MTRPTFDKNRVVVAMSGGVDSSVAALLLKEEGYDVIGISMKTHDLQKQDSPSHQGRGRISKTCCSLDDIQDARAVCRKLDIPFYAMNFKQAFQEQVIDYFAQEYLEGRTPNPCVKCNELLKFKALLAQARALGAYYLATGHYVQKRKDEEGRWHLYKARDSLKDQSYFLFRLGQEELASLLFPLGGRTKVEVRELARRTGLDTAEKPESQEICFVPDNDYVQLLERLHPELRQKTGVFRTIAGQTLGKHRGTHAYTIGQRRGLGLPAGERLYVTAIESARNEVIVGSEQELYRSSLQAQDVKWVAGLPAPSELETQVKIRYRHQAVPALIVVHKQGTATVTFKEPQKAITPGQAVVFYHGDELLGGGWIERAEV